MVLFFFQYLTIFHYGNYFNKRYVCCRCNKPLLVLLILLLITINDTDNNEDSIGEELKVYLQNFGTKELRSCLSLIFVVLE